MIESVKLLELLPAELQAGASGAPGENGYFGTLPSVGHWQLSAYTGPERWGLEHFCFAPLRVPFTGQNQVVSVHFDGDNRTIGYIIPSSALRSDSLHENRWQKVYATAASDFVVLCGGLNHVLAGLTAEHLIQGMELADLINSHYGVLVLGNDQLNQSNATIEEVLFSLQGIGVRRIAHSSKLRGSPTKVLQFTKRVPIPRVAKTLLPHLGALGTVAAAAGEQEHMGFRFLLLYQAFEIFIGKVFHSHLKDLVKDWETNSDDWSFREAVVKAANEKHRLRVLSTKFVADRRKGEAERGLVVACRDFSTLLPTLNKGEAVDWVDWLYTIRNLVVHRQAEILAIDHQKLIDVCDALSALIHVYATGFNLTEDLNS